MDLKYISNLIQVADHGSFSKAASVLGMTQPALGRQISKLEEECGAPLLYRHGRGVSLTPTGEKLLTRMRPLLREMESALLEIHDEQDTPSGQVTLGLTPTLCGIIGLRLVSTMRRDYPRIQLNIITGYSGYIHEWLTNARVDIGAMHDARRSPHLIVTPLLELELSLISATKSLTPAAQSMKSVPVSHLKDLSLVLPTNNHGLRRSVDYAASQAGFELPVAFEIDALNLMREITIAGLAHTVLSELAVLPEIAQGTLIARRLIEPTISTRIVTASASNRPYTPAVRLVESTLRRVVQEAVKGEPLSSAAHMLRPN